MSCFVPLHLFDKEIPLVVFRSFRRVDCAGELGLFIVGKIFMHQMEIL